MLVARAAQTQQVASSSHGSSSSVNEPEIVTKVLGERRGHNRGVGRKLKGTATSATSFFSGQSSHPTTTNATAEELAVVHSIFSNLNKVIQEQSRYIQEIYQNSMHDNPDAPPYRHTNPIDILALETVIARRLGQPQPQPQPSDDDDEVNWSIFNSVCQDLLPPISRLSLESQSGSTTTCCPSVFISVSIMKLFNWMQSKFSSGQGHKSLNTATSATHPKKQEDLSDWPHGLLSIGTFGNNDHLATENEEIQDTASSSPDLSEFTPEEMGKLQKELIKLLSKKPQGEFTADLPLDRFLNCPSSLEVDRRLSTTVISNPDDKDEDIDRTIRVILGRCKDICMENSKKAIGKKSISFLLKKMFVCSSSFPPMPSPDRLPESRMERLLRAMLKNKMNAQKASSGTKLIENRKDAEDGSKWVKTDSEYIVLEI